MDLREMLTRAGVPTSLHEEALLSLQTAQERAEGLLWFKIKARLFKSGELASYLGWNNERLVEVRPDLNDYDIAPMVNITGHGDNAPWHQTELGVRPLPGNWMNQDPESDEYKAAVASNYWLPGTHPRSPESRKAWYKRNAGEFLAYRRGEPINFDEDRNPPVIYQNGDYKAIKHGHCWLVVCKRKVFWKLHIHTRVGFEIDNLWSFKNNTQAWYPVPGYALRAPVTSSSIPRFK